eukprot:gene5792-6916_t
MSAAVKMIGVSSVAASTSSIASTADHLVRTLAQEMVYAIAEIQARSHRTGKLGVTGDEMRVLREGVGRTMDYLRGVPNAAIARAATAAVQEFNRLGALRHLHAGGDDHGEHHQPRSAQYRLRDGDHHGAQHREQARQHQHHA